METPKQNGSEVQIEVMNKDDVADDDIIQVKDSEQNNGDVDAENYVDLDQKSLANRLCRSEKYCNSPIIHRRSRIDEILSIPDVAAALHEEEFTSLVRNKDQKIANRPPSPAFLKHESPTCEEDQSPINRFDFNFRGSETESVEASVVGIEDDKNSCESSSSSESNRSSASDSSLVVIKDKQNPPNPVVTDNVAPSQDAGDVYELIADSLGPLKTALVPDKESTLVGRRLSTSSNGGRQNGSDSSSKEDSENASPPSSVMEEEPYIEDYFDTYNRPTLNERRMLRKSGLFKNKSESQATVLTWRSLARAIQRVRRFNSLGEQYEDACELPELTPILKDPASKPTLRKKTVSFSRLPSEAPVKNAADCVSMMQGGHQFVKMRSNARIYNRFYWFDVTTSSLRWEPSKKDSGKAKIDISSIKEVRPGKATELFLSSDISSHFPEECAFSIIYSDYKNLDLIAGSVDEANIWITGLRCLLAGQDPEELQTRPDTRDVWLSSVFESADINGDGYLDEEESLELLKRLSDGIRETRIKQKLTEFLRFKDRDRTRLTKDEFVELFKDVTTRPEIYFLLARHASKDDRLSVDDLMLFLESDQGLTDVTKEVCLDLIERYEPSLELKAIPAFGIDGFTKYLMSRECNIFDPAHAKVCQDMTQPLSHYYIASSHNTYLMEDQLSGPSNVGAYIRALLRCCRCIELDCWDGPEGRPVIKHGHTQSNSISFEQTIEAIKECSFKNSPYPVILCIENHCSIEQQKVMASVLKSILGDQIYTAPPTSDTDYLPSPDSLKNKFLIKGKKLPPDLEGDEGEVSGEDEGAEINEKVPPSPVKSPFSIGPGILLSRKRIEEDEEEEIKPKQKLCRELSDLVSLCVSVRMSDNDLLFVHSKSRKFYEITSMHERTATQLSNNSPEEFVNFNKKFLTRVHPSAVRVDSSNFNPQDYWNCGVQIASLNYQTPGLMMDINDGRFAMNGGCGYVLKPTIMREEVAYFSAQQNDVIPSVAPKILHLRIISGQEFPKPRGGGAKGHVIDPYVLIELFGMMGDCSEQRTRTSHDCGSGNSTALFDESFEFRLTVPDLALVRFVVLDDEFIGDEFIGQYTIPFECLRPGYRHLRLRSIFDEPLDDATLFVHIAVTDGSMQLSHSNSMPNMPNTVSSPGPMPPSSTGSISTGSFKLSKKRSSSSGALLKQNKKAQQQQQARRERAAAMRIVGVKKIDETFQTASPALRDAGEMKENLHQSLCFFKEVCGLPALSSVKQCIRNLALRANLESQQNNVSNKKLSRKASLDQNPNSYSPVNGIGSQGTPKMRDKNNFSKIASRGSSESLNLKTDASGKFALKMVFKNNCPTMEIYNLATQPPSSSDMWRKVLAGFQSLVNDARYVVDNANKCQESLSLIHQEALKYHENLPSLLNVTASALSDPSRVTGSPSSKKQKKKDKKRTPSGISISGNAEWDFAWNCSVIRGHLDILKSAQKEAATILTHLREAGSNSGLIGDEDITKIPIKEHVLRKSDSKLSNCSDASRDSTLAGQGDELSSGSDSSSQQGKSEEKDSISSASVTESKNVNNNNLRGSEEVPCNSSSSNFTTSCPDVTNNITTASKEHPPLNGIEFFTCKKNGDSKNSNEFVQNSDLTKSQIPANISQSGEAMKTISEEKPSSLTIL
ncbi:inactive phospholipase C-like protein 1 isoform X1 [Styela clava]